jgi:outer membrane protein
MKNRLIALAALLAILLPVSFYAQSATPQSATPAQAKVGVMNIQAAILNCAEGKKAFEDLKAKYQPRQQELQRLQQEIQAIQDQLSKQSATLSDEEQSRLNREAEEKQKLYNRSLEDFKNDSNRDQEEVLNKVGQKMLRVINDYAQQNGFTLIVGDDQRVPVYFAAKDVELTEEITKRYDAANPVAVAATPAKPVAKPAASTPAPK